jgi:hypothetical protein
MKKGIPAAAHWSRSANAHRARMGRTKSFGTNGPPHSPLTITHFPSDKKLVGSTISPINGEQETPTNQPASASARI